MKDGEKGTGGRIWSPQTAERSGNISEVIKDEIESKFIACVAKDVAELLGIGWKDRDTVEALLKSALRDSIKSLLEQYLHSELDEIAERFNEKFDMALRPDYRNATHGKLNSIMKEIARRRPAAEDEKDFELTQELLKKIEIKAQEKYNQIPDPHSHLRRSYANLSNAAKAVLSAIDELPSSEKNHINYIIAPGAKLDSNTTETSEPPSVCETCGTQENPHLKMVRVCEECAAKVKDNIAVEGTLAYRETHPTFTRTFFQAVRDEANRQGNKTSNPYWKRAYADLSRTADQIDAMISRRTETSIEAMKAEIKK